MPTLFSVSSIATNLPPHCTGAEWTNLEPYGSVHFGAHMNDDMTSWKQRPVTADRSNPTNYPGDNLVLPINIRYGRLSAHEHPSILIRIDDEAIMTHEQRVCMSFRRGECPCLPPSKRSHHPCVFAGREYLAQIVYAYLGCHPVLSQRLLSGRQVFPSLTRGVFRITGHIKRMPHPVSYWSAYRHSPWMYGKLGQTDMSNWKSEMYIRTNDQYKQFHL